jgi:LAO/AO transport system kinase
MKQEDIKKELKEALLKAAKAGRITCTEARKLAEKKKVSYGEIGRVADELNIKITNCELGCF